MTTAFNIKAMGGRYYLDLDRYMSFIAEVSSSERLTNSVITSTYSDDMPDGDDMSMMTKEIVESKGNGAGNELFHQIRYEILKSLVASLTTGYTNDGLPVSSRDDETVILETVEQKLAFNTLVKYGILAQIKE